MLLGRLISVAAVTLLAASACSGLVRTTPTPTPTPTPTAALPTPTPTPTPVAEMVTLSVVDPAGTDEFFAEVPAGWITITARDIADEASFEDWVAAHPEVPHDAAASVAEDMSIAGVSLFAFDAENAVGGFTPNLSATWVDAPVRNFQGWLAEQATKITKDYVLASPLEYRAWAPKGEGTLGGFIGAYRYSMKDNTGNDTALAGSQMIVPMPDGRAAVLTFTCRDDQVDHFGPIIQALFTSLSAHS